ncbi:MAG: RnfH family protein [Gammaproteobacteria bacterium]|nr:RnfH family protein [Gammaproteobacteria bacterium]
MAPDESVAVEVVYATRDRQVVIALNVAPGSTLRAAIERSRILQQCPDIDLAVNRIGVFGKLRDPGDPCRDGDRIEIYRPLVADPKEQRRRRAGG